jgi:hypothetical protein
MKAAKEKKKVVLRIWAFRVCRSVFVCESTTPSPLLHCKRTHLFHFQAAPAATPASLFGGGEDDEDNSKAHEEQTKVAVKAEVTREENRSSSEKEQDASAASLL